MAKTMKSYRIEQYTLNRLSWLCQELDLSETSTVELAITELYMKYYYDVNYFGRPKHTEIEKETQG